MLAPVLVTPPTETPVSLVEMKAHLRVDHDEDDDLIAGFIAGATSYLDGHGGVLGRALVAQTWRQDFQAFPCGTAFLPWMSLCFQNVLRLPLFPVASVTTVSYFDAAGAAQTLDAGAYRLLTDSLGAFVLPSPGASWPSTACRPDAVSVTFVAGQGAATKVDAADKIIIKLLAGHWYEHRAAVNIGNITSEIPLGVAALIARRRRPVF